MRSWAKTSKLTWEVYGELEREEEIGVRVPLLGNGRRGLVQRLKGALDRYMVTVVWDRCAPGTVCIAVVLLPSRCFQETRSSVEAELLAQTRKVFVTTMHGTGSIEGDAPAEVWQH